MSFAFRILAHGSVLGEYDVVQDKQMHLILVRRDLAVFRPALDRSIEPVLH